MRAGPGSRGLASRGAVWRASAAWKSAARDGRSGAGGQSCWLAHGHLNERSTPCRQASYPCDSVTFGSFDRDDRVSAAGARTPAAIPSRRPESTSRARTPRTPTSATAPAPRPRSEDRLRHDSGVRRRARGHVRRPLRCLGGGHGNGQQRRLPALIARRRDRCRRESEAIVPARAHGPDRNVRRPRNRSIFFFRSDGRRW